MEINRNDNRRSKTTLVLQYQSSSNSLKFISVGAVIIIIKNIELFINTKGAKNNMLRLNETFSTDHSSKCIHFCCNGNESSLIEWWISYNCTFSQTRTRLKCGGILLALQ